MVSPYQQQKTLLLYALGPSVVQCAIPRWPGVRKVAKRMKSSEKRLGRNHHTDTIAVAIFFFVLLKDNLVWHLLKQ